MDRSFLRESLVLTVTFFVIGPLVALAITVNFLSADRTRSAQLGWEATLGTWDEVMRRFPATEANATALELEQLAAALGVDLTPTGAPRHDWPWRTGSRSAALLDPTIPAPVAAFDRLKRESFGRYTTDQLELVERGRLAAPPAVLLGYMRAYNRELEALRRRLNRGDLAVWESDLSRLDAAPIPNLAGHIDLHKLLASVALAQVHDGDTNSALETVEASWNLARSLRDAPHVISQLIYVSAAELQTGVLRHIRDLPDAWAERLRGGDHRQSLVTALKIEGWAWIHVGAGSMHRPEAGWLERMTDAARGPYLKLCLAEVSDRWRRKMGRMERVTTLCDRNLAAEGAELNIEVSRWNRVGKMLTPNLSGTIHRVARLELDRELLLLAIEADAARRSAGAWPPTGERPSAACPADRWIYTPSDGRLEIALSREIGWPGQSGAILPHRIVLD